MSTEIKFTSGARARIGRSRAVRGSDAALPPICFPSDEDIAAPSACTVSVGSIDDQPLVEPAVTITVTGSDLSGIDHSVGSDRTAIAANGTRRDFETIDVSEGWTATEIATALVRAKVEGVRGVTLVAGDPAKLVENLNAIARKIGERLLPAFTVLAREFEGFVQWLRTPRGRRSRQNRSTRARGARRLRDRVSPPPPLPPMTITLGGRR